MPSLAVGVDIGGTNTAIGLVDREGNVHTQTSMQTTGHASAEEFVRMLCNEIRALAGDSSVVGIGIGAPNGNYYNGTIEFAPNLPWSGVIPLVEMTRRHFALPVTLTNDANAAAMGEMIYGGAKEMRDFIVITLGTGVGSGIVVNGALVYGHDGFAGEIGHTIVDINGRQCGCGRRGCLETYASAPGLKRTVFELLADSTQASTLRGFAYNDLTAAMIANAAHHGDAVARQAFERTGRILGLKLADAIAHTSPEAIFLFGGLAQAGELIFEPTRRHMEEFMLNIFKQKVKLLPSGLEQNAAVLGASALVWNELA